MRTRILAFWLSGLLPIATSAQSAEPAATPPRNEVELAKAALHQAADQAFVSSWSEVSRRSSQSGVTAHRFRLAGRWSVMAYNLGACSDLASPQLVAEWRAAFDNIDLGATDASNKFRRDFQQQAFRGLDEGQADNPFANQAAPKARLCGAMLAAIAEEVADLRQ